MNKISDKFTFFKKIMIIFLTLIFIVSLTLGDTIAKYIIEEKVSFEDDKEIQFTVNSVFVVSTAEELFAAINQGYTYVQLDKEIENPLIITQKAENLHNDLILDLNGIEIQRNGSEPILNINEGIRLTIVDSSDEQTGGLYNPVGSVFNINGGSLSVVTGFFESGPRYSEYYTYNNLVLNNDTNSTTKRTIVETDAQEVNYYTNNSSTSEVKTAPIIKSYPTKTGEITYNHGNLYFDKEITKGEITIKNDTYCYYQTSEKSAFEILDTSMAAWHYSYYVNEDYDYVGTSSTNEKDIEVTIYGYENVIEEASKIVNKTDYYAAIQMSKGTLDVQNGAFYQYFGVDTTACVNAQGGTINIIHGSFSSRVPNATKYSYNSVQLKESDKNAFIADDYFNNFEWNSSDSNSIAKKGESYCILNGGSATVNIGTGKLYSSNNNIISMQGGELSISGGDFTKSLTNGLSYNNDKYLAAINMQSGTLLIENSNFNINGNSTYGIYSTVGGNNNFNISNTTFEISGDDSTGIYSSKGTVHLSSDYSASISINGKNSKGIYVNNGGSVVSNNYSYNLFGDNSYGIYSSSGTIAITNGNITLSSDNNCYGIYAASDDLITIDIDNSIIAIGCKINNNKTPLFNTSNKSGAIAASAGVFLSSQNTQSKINLTNINIYSYELGVVSNGGTINLYDEGNIITNKASAIAIKNGNVTFNENSNYNIVSNSTTNSSFVNSYTLTLPSENDSVEEYKNSDGIYVENGSFSSKGNLSITHTGLQNKTLSSGYNYSSLVVTSYAVRVYGGNVNIDKGTIIAKIGGGIYVGKNGNTKGSITLGLASLINETIDKNTGRTDIVKVYTEGNLVGDIYDSIGTIISDSWKSYQSITGGHAVELDGGNITIYNGIYEAQFGNGIFVNGTSNANEENGNIDVYNGLFYGYMNAVGISDNKTINLSGKSGPSAFYGLKIIGGSEVHIYDGFFDGGNGGAFVTGVTSISNEKIQSSKTAYVYIYKGTFGADSGNLDAFNVYDDVNIVFGAYNADAPEIKNNDASTIQGLITLKSTTTSIAANSITNTYSDKTTNIYIYYGTYSGQMFMDSKMISTSYFTYNINTNDGSYTSCTSTIYGNQNNTTAQFYNG